VSMFTQTDVSMFRLNEVREGKKNKEIDAGIPAR
jgi:hypothetical protein